MGAIEKKSDKEVTGLKILIVDDDPDFCDITKTMLIKEGYEVTTCTDGPEALEIAKEDLFDVALVDLRIPMVGGHEILRFFKEMRPKTEVIMISAFADDFIAKALAKEAFAYLHKPFDIKDLEKLIKIIAEGKSKPRGRKKPVKFKVLVVDNDRGVCEIFRKASNKLQCQVKTVEDGDAAITMAKKAKFDLIFFDIFLPGCSGMAVFKSLREISPLSKIILMVSHGHSAKNLVEEALRCGVYGFIYKPFALKEIEEFIGRIKVKSSPPPD